MYGFDLDITNVEYDGGANLEFLDGDSVLLNDGFSSELSAEVVDSLQSNGDKIDVEMEDSIINTSDSLLSDTIAAPKKEFLDAKVEYTAKDSIVFYSDGTGFLYGSGDVKYLQAKPIQLKAEYIRFKLDSSTIYAIGGTDTLGKPIGEPIFIDGGQEYVSKYMSYNFKTKKGFVKGGVTQQDEGFIVADKTKMMADQTMCMMGGKYTTCDNHDHPHFYLQLTKAKVKPGSYMAAGPAYLVMADVPLPIAVPFGFFPFTNKYSSGVIMPQFGDEFQRGFYLKNGGYYWAINDYVDLEVIGEIYTKGTWGVSLASKYGLRYKFSGSLQATYREDVTGEKNMPDYSKAKNFKIRWQHRQDAKASQYSSFAASVDFSTSGYNTSNVNNYYNPTEQSKNITSSSINYTQRFPDSKWSLSLNASLQQRTQDSTISLNLPSLTVNLSQINPFKRKQPVGKERWYEKITLSYSMAFSNSISTKENMLFKSSFTKDWRNAIKHTLPISASFTLFKYINLSLSQNYTERWYFNKINKDWDITQQREVRDTTFGFYRVYDFSSNVSLNTKLYGYYTPIRKLFGDKIDRIRHVMTPNVSFSYNPDFGNPLFKFYDSYNKVMVDKNSLNPISEEEVIYSPFSHGMYGVPGRGVSSTISFNINNNIEMKVKDKSDSTGMAYKKVSLIDMFNIGWAYNFAADSMNWSNLTLGLRLKLTKRFSLNLRGAFDPYRYVIKDNGSAVRTGQLHWDYKQPMHFTGTKTDFSYTFDNNTFKRKSQKTDSDVDKEDGNENSLGQGEIDPITGLPIEQDNNKDKSKNEKQDIDNEGFVKLEIPWSLTVSYSVGFYENRTKEYYVPRLNAYRLQFRHNLSINGSIEPTPKWRLTYNAYFDLTEWQINQMSMSVTRDLHCWHMSASIAPFGLYKSFLVTVGVNAAMLRDLKYEKRSDNSSDASWL